MEQNKPVLIGTFVKKGKILSFIEYLNEKFNISSNAVFIYEIEGNENEYIATFRTKNKEKYLKQIKNSTVLHIKNGSLFSINALNKLIEEEGCVSDHADYLIDWSKHKNELIILTSGELTIKSLSRIEDKAQLIK